MAEYRRGRGPHFAQIPFDLLDDPEADAYVIASYAAVKSYADFGSGAGADVSDETACKRAGCSPRKFRQCREWLRKKGWLEWEGRAGKTNRYVVHSSPETPAPHAEVEEEAPRHDVPTPPAPRADPPRHHVPTTESHVPRANTESASSPSAQPPVEGHVSASAEEGSPSVPGQDASVEEDPPSKSWSTLAGEVWEEVFGGTGPYGRIGKALKPLVEKYGEDEVLTQWRRYLEAMRDDGRGSFATAEDFAARYGYYREYGVKLPRNGNGRHRTTDQQQYSDGIQSVEEIRWKN